MRRHRLPGLHGAALAALLVLLPAGVAHARTTVLDDDPGTVARLVTPGPGRLALLPDADDLLEVGTTALAPARRAARVPASALRGRGAAAMAATLREAAESSGARQAWLDDLGPSFAGADGEALASALGILAGQTPSWAPDGVNRHVQVYLPSPGSFLTDPAWAGARRAAALAGGVWLETYHGATAWPAAEWTTWPAETARVVGAAGGSAARVHVVIRGSGDQGTTWTRARTGSACQVLLNGPGAVRLGGDADAFVAQFRAVFDTSGGVRAACLPARTIPNGAAVALDGAAARERTGLAIPAGGLLTPPLAAGAPAQLVLQLGPDPLGLSAGFNVTSERIWRGAGAQVQVDGPGVHLRVPVEGDGTARMQFTPTGPGGIVMRLILNGAALPRSGGPDIELVPALRRVGASASFVTRVLADPMGWTLSIPLNKPGEAPGSPVAAVVETS
jgi:hypothetical protein